MRLRLFIISVFLLTSYNHLAAQTTIQEQVVLEEHALSIYGTSNVNDFECIYNNISEPDTLEFDVEVNESVFEIEGDSLSMYVESFDCGRKGINRDFRKTMRSEEYPTINVVLQRIIHEDDIPVIAEVLISLAGVSRLYQVDIRDQSNKIPGKIQGTKVVRLSDFNLKPPKALFGLIKVRDEMDVNFTLSVRK